MYDILEQRRVIYTDSKEVRGCWGAAEGGKSALFSGDRSVLGLWFLVSHERNLKVATLS